MTYNSKF